MPFYIITQPEVRLKQFLNRRESIKSQNQTESVNDFFIRSKYDSQQRLKRSKRFNTSLGEHCDVDFRIETRYKPSIDYKFTGENFKTKYCRQKQMNSLNATTKQKQIKSLILGSEHKTQIGFQSIFNRRKRKNEPEKKNDLSINEELNLTKLLSITSQHEDKEKSRCKSLKQEYKFRIGHPTPVKEAEFLVKMKRDFVKRHRQNKREKKSMHRNDLIKIQDYITQKKQIFKRSMQTELIRIGQGRLLSRIEERKGKIYLGGLHNAGKKKKSIENIDQLLRKSRGSFSTPNNLISHLKLSSEKKNKLETISKLKQRTMDDCLQKIKSLNMKSQMISHSIKEAA